LVLVFVGLKMSLVEIYKLPTLLSLGVVAALIGVLAPVLLQRFGRDPAMGSSIILTATTHDKFVAIWDRCAVQFGSLDFNGTVAAAKEAMAMGDPEMMKLAAMKKIAEFSVTDKYAKEHPFLAMMIEMGKPKVLEMLETSFPGSATSVSLQPSRSPRPVRGSSDI